MAYIRIEPLLVMVTLQISLEGRLSLKLCIKTGPLLRLIKGQVQGLVNTETLVLTQVNLSGLFRLFKPTTKHLNNRTGQGLLLT
jgi:hypothetical protein